MKSDYFIISSPQTTVCSLSPCKQRVPLGFKIPEGNCIHLNDLFGYCSGGPGPLSVLDNEAHTQRINTFKRCISLSVKERWYVKCYIRNTYYIINSVLDIVIWCIKNKPINIPKTFIFQFTKLN